MPQITRDGGRQIKDKQVYLVDEDDGERGVDGRKQVLMPIDADDRRR